MEDIFQINSLYRVYFCLEIHLLKINSNYVLIVEEEL